MDSRNWMITFLVHRQKGGEKPHFERFSLHVSPDEYVLDAVERIWAFHDRSLTFRHACHHSTCGACGMRVNGAEKLACITLLRDVVRDGGTLKLEPLRNFPVVSDLVVDMREFYLRLEEIDSPTVLPLSAAPLTRGNSPLQEVSSEEDDLLRLVDCIECGMCLSACPVVATDSDYFGPAVLAGIHQKGVERSPQLLELVDSSEGVWRCHSAFECTEVCPSNVEPAWRIMKLRKQAIKHRLKSLI